MTLKSFIVDRFTKIAASVSAEDGEKAGLVVATRPLKYLENKIMFFSNPDYGHNMNIALGFAGTPVPIHNGTDNVYWTASAISGPWTFDSVVWSHAGTKSIDATATVNNSTAQFTKAASIDLSGYVAVTGWIYLDSWDNRGTKEIQVYGWDTGTGTQVGVSVNLANYINIGLTDNEQKFTVPLIDFELAGSTIDAIRIQTVDIGPGDPPDYRLDDIQIEETVAPEEFKIEPDDNTWLHVNNYSILIVDAYAGTLADATMPYLSYDKLLGLASLTNGILYQRAINRRIPLSFPFRNLGDILMFPGARLQDYGSDGTNTFLKFFVKLYQPILLKKENADKISFLVSDDLSGLVKLIISANCREEVRV
jgi:hypothetical protein